MIVFLILGNSVASLKFHVVFFVRRNSRQNEKRGAIRSVAYFWKVCVKRVFFLSSVFSFGAFRLFFFSKMFHLFLLRLSYVHSLT